MKLHDHDTPPTAEERTQMSRLLLHFEAAHSLARWLTHNELDAEDVVQETCLRAFRLIANFTSGNARDRVPHANLHPHAIALSRRSSEIGAGGNANANAGRIVPSQGA